MPVTVRIPTPLRKLTEGQAEIPCEGATVGAVLDDLEIRHPGLKSKICDDAGKVRRFVNIFANDEDIRYLSDLATEIADGDELSIIPAIAGGAAA